MSLPILRPWRRLRRDQRGVSAVEYALVAPLLFAVLFVAIEVIIILFADSMLEATANRVTRLGKLGIPEGQTCAATVRTEAESMLSNWIVNPADLRIDVNIYRPGQSNLFEDVDDEGYEPICDAGDRGDIVMYRLMLDRPGITGFLHWLGIQIVRLERSVVIQNEP